MTDRVKMALRQDQSLQEMVFPPFLKIGILTLLLLMFPFYAHGTFFGKSSKKSPPLSFEEKLFDLKDSLLNLQRDFKKINPNYTTIILYRAPERSED